MTTAVIDIGTNTVLLLVAAFHGRGKMDILEDEQRSPRLGEGVDATRSLNPDSMRRAIDVLREYKSIIHKHPINAIIVAGTSAVRDAGNVGRFRELIWRATGFELEVLGGSEEALWTFRGALSGFPSLKRASVLDIGGGSTELTTGTATAIQQSVSLDVGSVRLFERFFRSNPPEPGSVEKAKMFIRDTLSTSGVKRTKSTLIAVAGTATSLALLDQGMTRFDRTAVTGYCLTRARVSEHLKRLVLLSSSEIRDLSTALQGREDIITAGALILLTTMDSFGFDEVLVSERGIRYGLALREWEQARKRNGWTSQHAGS